MELRRRAQKTLSNLSQSFYIPIIQCSIFNYKIQTVEQKKLLDDVKEILESGNKTAVEALESNIRAFLEMVRISKKNDEDKGGN